MKRTALFLLTLMTAGLMACSPAAEESEPVAEAAPARHPIVGAWSITGSSAVAADGSETTNTNPQPSLHLFVEGYYSVMYAAEDTALAPRSEARRLYADEVWPPESRPTDSDKIAAYDSFIANSGTYEISESTLTTDPIVAKDPNFMTHGSVTYEYQIDGDTLQLTATDDEGGTNRLTLRRLE